MAPAAPVSREGDLWLLGGHRLICGDATDPYAVGLLLRKRAAAPLRHRPALWRELRPRLAQPRRGLRDEADRPGDERRPGRLARGLGPVSRRRRVRLAWRAARRERRREPPCLGLRRPQPDHLEQGAAGALAAATTTGSTSPAGTRCGGRRRATGTATGSRPRSGTSRAATRTPRRCTAPRSRSSACAGRSSTTRRRARRCTSPSPDRGRRSSRPRPPGGAATPWSSTRPMSTSRCCAGRIFPARQATLEADGRSFAEVAEERGQ